ncbi:MAG TPA: adenylate/guanylate cyclase domain-containing protein [Beijerinckiaceae bacterium]|nr:adenylate/guanylate cyclase domain-containing protein [Beijerinckiaceae bacterium]
MQDLPMERTGRPLPAAGVASSGEPQERRGRSPRVRIHIALTVLLAAVSFGIAGGMLVVQIDGSRNIIRDSAFAYMDAVAVRVVDRTAALVDPVSNVLHVLATRPALLETTTPADRMVVPGFVEALRQFDDAYGMLVGYADGNFLWVESLRVVPPSLHVGFDAPETAAYRLTEIRRDGDHRVQRRWWLDAGGARLAEIDVAIDPPYDPRTRPWYRDAHAEDAPRISPVYMFAALQTPGYTVRVPLAGNVDGVLATDILLSSVEAFLKAQRVSPNGRVVLLDDRDQVVASGVSELLERGRAESPGEPTTPPMLSTLGYPALEAAVAQWRRTGEGHIAVVQDGRTYIASIHSMGAGFRHGMYVAVIAPLDEFFGAIEALRLRMLLYAGGIALVALPIAVLLGRRIARQLRAIAEEAGRIRQLELTATAPLSSRIIEVDQLARSIERTKLVVRDFAHFVPRRLVEQLVSSGTSLALGGERRELTILFTDVVGFTSLAERADPATLMRQASRYLGTLSNAISAHGGTIDKYIGDSIMAFWNAPSSDPDHVAHACEAILACRGAGRQLDDAFAAEGWPPMRTRYGLHVGEVIVGNIGSADRMSYTALGPAVNLASRLEALNTRYGTDVLVSEMVATRCRDRFIFRRVDRVQPKGLTQSLMVFTLIGSTIDPTAAERLALWTDVLAAYDWRDWPATLRKLEHYRSADPDDPVAVVYLERCRQFLEAPPPESCEVVAAYDEK